MLLENSHINDEHWVTSWWCMAACPSEPTILIPAFISHTAGTDTHSYWQSRGGSTQVRDTWRWPNPPYTDRQPSHIRLYFRTRFDLLGVSISKPIITPTENFHNPTIYAVLMYFIVFTLGFSLFLIGSSLWFVQLNLLFPSIHAASSRFLKVKILSLTFQI